MSPLVYPDCLDTVRTDVSAETSSLTLAQIKFHLLIGETPCLSQSQSFDSVHLLAYAEDASFRDLVHHGEVVLCLEKGASGPVESFLAKLADPGFHLSAWPEIEGADAATRDALTAEMREAFRDDSEYLNTDFPELEQRWAALHALNHAYRNAPAEQPRLYWDPHEMRTDAVTLSRALEQVSAVAEGHPLQADIAALAALRSNRRSEHHRFIDRKMVCEPEDREALHDIVNMRYNAIVAGSLHAAQSLSSYSLPALDLMDAMDGSDSDAPRRNDGSSQKEREVAEPLTWATLLKIRKVFRSGRLSLEQKMDRLRDMSVLGAGEAVAANGERQMALKMIPGAFAVTMAPIATHVLSYALGGPDAAALAQGLMTEAQKQAGVETVLRFTGVDFLDRKLNSAAVRKILDARVLVQPEEWLREKMRRHYEHGAQARLLSLLERGMHTAGRRENAPGPM